LEGLSVVDFACNYFSHFVEFVHKPRHCLQSFMSANQSTKTIPQLAFFNTAPFRKTCCWFVPIIRYQRRHPRAILPKGLWSVVLCFGRTRIWRCTNLSSQNWPTFR